MSFSKTEDLKEGVKVGKRIALVGFDPAGCT
jgi:hypothetical protein